MLLGWLALQKIGIGNIASALLNSSPAFVLLGLAIMCSAMVLRAFSWYAILRAALPRARVTLSDAMQGTFIGVLMSSTLPARLGEPSRALVVARRTGRPRENLPVVLGTLVSQTLINIVALDRARHGHVLVRRPVQRPPERPAGGGRSPPITLLALVLLAPVLLRAGAKQARFARVHAADSPAAARADSRAGRADACSASPARGAIATAAQLSAWGLQWLSCYVLLVALGLNHQTGIAAAAAVLFAVNITAVLPATPANLGVFQAACAAVLHRAGTLAMAPASPTA